MEEKEILRELEEINVKPVDKDLPSDEFWRLVGESNRLINGLRELANWEQLNLAKGREQNG